MAPKDLIKFYNALVSLMVEGRFRPSYGRRGGFKHFTEANLESARLLLEWLVEKGFEAKPYLAGCFADHNWCYQPKWDRLKEKRYQDAYKGGVAWQWWEILQREDRFADKPEGLHPGHEIIKARYFHDGDGTVCFVERMAGRYRADSQFCQGCAYKERCHDQSGVCLAR